MWQLEFDHHRNGHRCIAGIDEAGRGAWAGPVVVAAVILPPDWQARPYRDSKTLTAQTRNRLAEVIKSEAIAWALGFASALEVDQCGVLEATKHASLRAIALLEPKADALITDYLKLNTPLPSHAPPRADASSYSVAAASILAKTARDAWMIGLHTQHTSYGFDAHKGYGTRMHQAALEQLGITPEHRRSFRPVALIADGLFNSQI